MNRSGRPLAGSFERAGTVSTPLALLEPNHRELVRLISHRIRLSSMAKGPEHA
jgi:hypothetical protein